MITPAHPFTPEQLAEQARLKRAMPRVSLCLGRMLTADAVADTLDALEVPDDDGVLDGACGVMVADCALHDWRNGTLARQFPASRHARGLSDDERRLAGLWQHARLSLLRVHEVWPGHGLRVHDAILRCDLDLIDPLLARPEADGFWMIARVFSPGGYWMTTPMVTLLGPLPDEGMGEIVATQPDAFTLARLALDVHLTLSGEAVGHGEEEGFPDPDPELLDAVFPEAPPPPRPPGRNDPCPCGSGKKYKKCCALAPRPNVP